MFINKVLKTVFIMVVAFFVLCIAWVIFVFSYNFVNRPYDNFTALMKWEDDFHDEIAFKELYPLILKKDAKAMLLVSEMYYFGGKSEYFKKDLVKANIWDQRSQCKCFDTGIKEYNVYQKYLLEKNYLKAQEFLLLAANNGNKKAILHLKDDSYLEDNFLNISEKDREYWKVFEYEKLYPYIDKIMNDPSLSDK